VGYVTGATNNFDNGYDGETFDANEFVDFYSVNQEKNLVIQGRALPFDENDEVQLGFRSSVAAQ
jgi:propanediol dehydratase large subunit